MTFGHFNAPAASSRLIQFITNGIENAFERIDDILIASETVEDQLDTLAKIFLTLSDLDVQFKVEKTELFQKRLSLWDMLLRRQVLFLRTLQ